MTGKPLRRYTTLPSLIHVLRHRRLTLLDPATWDDKNDSEYLAIYREKRNLRSVLALCFAQASETYHHWRVFAGGAAGVCIELHRPGVEESAAAVAGVRIQDVEYLTLKKIKESNVKTNRLPFTKRFAFQPEDEVRLLWESKTEEKTSLGVPISLHDIVRVTLSPWLHESMADEVKELLRSIPGCKGIKIFRSTLIGNAEWIRAGRMAK